MGACPAATMNQGISGVMWKTVSEACNLACDYCYYSRLQGKPGRINRIDEKVLEKFIIEYMEMKRGVVPFAWQGGEPLMAGLPFFEKVIELQAKHAPNNTIISNSIQTNGTLINEKWAKFFKRYNFLVGVSIDGPEEINDRRRVTGAGTGSYDAIKRGIQHLKNEGVEFNVLTVVHEDNVHKAKELMEFYKEENYSHVQFIPCMDFLSQDVKAEGKYLITPEEFGDFLCEAFDIWYNDGEPEISVRFFDNMLMVYLNHNAEACEQSETCPKTIIFEQNGDAYPCDFLIHDDFKLGNIGVDSLESIVNHERMEAFLEQKPALPEDCRSCEFLSLCHGGCPRTRREKGRGTEYFCESYKQLYRYADERMERLSQAYKKKELEKFVVKDFKFPARNEACVCGGNKKYKQCCQPVVQELQRELAH